MNEKPYKPSEQDAARRNKTPAWIIIVIVLVVVMPLSCICGGFFCAVETTGPSNFKEIADELGKP